MRQIIFITAAFYFLLILQTSFLVHFDRLRSLPNLAVVFFILAILWEPKTDKTGLILAVPSGLLLDIFTAKPLGFYPLVLLSLSFLIKFVIKNHVRIPLGKRV